MWAIALTAADHSGWIKAPVDGEVGGPTRDICKHDPTWLLQGEIATGARLGANFFVKSAGLINPVSKNDNCKKLNTPSTLPLSTGAGGLSTSGGNNGAVTAFLSLGSSSGGANAGRIQWSAQDTIASGVGGNRASVRFADLKGDGRAEYLKVNNDAKVTWIPQGTIASGVGVGRDSVVFTDINGDGKAGYIALSETDGSAQLWLNGGRPHDGPNAAKVVWLPQGKIADGVGNSWSDVQFSDLNGGSRAEYLDVKFDTSAVSA
ncbi:hypothetical protein H9Q69_006720 [Fusarium xylarioides]|nr:hypothetical protein H9Q69_006720 [Fusarium xylarioides]